jgi:hypothetical protein
MRRWRYPFSLIGLSGVLLLMILSRVPSILAAQVLTVGVADPNSLYGQAGTPFNVQFTATGGAVGATYTYDLVTGTVPSGTQFFGNVGQLTDAPDPGTEGSYTLGIQAKDDAGNTSPVTNFTVCVGMAISPATLPDITYGVLYGPFTISSTCGKGTVTFGLSGAPNGITFVDNGDGTATISGTATDASATPVAYTLVVTATDSGTPVRTSTKNYPVTLRYPDLKYTPAKLPNGTKDSVYPTTTVTFSNRPGTLTVTSISGVGGTSLPTGMTLTPGSGKFTLSGTPTTTGSYQVVVEVSDANNIKTTVTFPFTVSGPVLSITPLTLPQPNATVNTPYSQAFTVTGGVAPYFITMTVNANSGLSLVPAGGISADGTFSIDGTPKAAGSYPITITARDSSTPPRQLGNGGAQVYNLSVTDGASPIYGSVPPVGSTISFGLVGTPGTEVSQALVITNSGAATLKVCTPDIPCSPIFSGTNAGDFRFTGAVIPPLTVPAGGFSATLVIACKPSSTLFASTATMTLRTNDPLRQTVTYQLSCNTIIPTATPGIGTPTAISGTARPSVEVLGRATAVVTDAPDTFATLTFVKGLALRSGPYLGATMLGVLKRDKAYPVLALNSGDGEGKFNWYLVVDEDNKRIGWASGRYLILKGDPNIPYTPTIFDQIDNAPDVKARLTIFGNVNIRARPSDRMPVIHTTAYGTELQIIGRTQQAGITQWVQVRYFDETGRTIVGWVYYNFNAPELMKLTGIAPLDAVPLR